MKLKLDADGHAVVQDGKPVYVKDDGTEIAFDAAGTVATIGRLTAENNRHRERAVDAEGKLKAFDGIEDPKKALEALNVVANLDAKKLVDAGEIEKVKAEISKAFQQQIDETKKASQAQIDEISQKRQQLEQQLYAEKVGGAFARSKLIAEKLAIPPDLVEARFGKQFVIEDGKVVGTDMQGNRLYSQTRFGELADFDEALEILINQYPHKDSIFKGTGASGIGMDSSKGSGGATPKGNLGGTREERLAAIRANMPTGISP